MITISIDYDETMNDPEVLEFIKTLRKSAYKINIICLTGRHDDHHKDHAWGDNKELYKALSDLCINQVYFMNGVNKKYEWLKGSDITLHLDDNPREIKLINKYTDTYAIDINMPEWDQDALRVICAEISGKLSEFGVFNNERIEPF